MYLYSLGKPGARGKVSCLPMTPLPSFESIHHFDFYVLSHTQKVHLSIWLNWEKPNLQLDAFQGRENRCPWTPPQPPPQFPSISRLGIFMCYFFPPTAPHKMPLPLTSFEQIGILIILFLLDFNPQKTCLLHLPQLTCRNFPCNGSRTSLGSLSFQHFEKLSSSVLIKLGSNWRRELHT